jgi:hypothetical protein
MHLVNTNLDDRRPLPEGWPTEGEAPAGAEVDVLTAVASTGRPVAEVLFFALEDARQERQGLEIYPGARSVLADLYASSLTSAVSRSAGLSQFVLGCFLLTGAYVERAVLEKQFEPRAAVAIDEASSFCDEAAEATDPWQVAQLALELEEVARTNGLIAVIPETGTTRAQTRMRQEHEAGQASEGLDMVRLTTPILANPDSYQQTRRSGEARSGESDRTGASEIADDVATDQLLRVSQAPEIYLPTGQGGKILVGAVPRAFSRLGPLGVESLRERSAVWEVSQRRVSGELYPLFAANQRRGLRSGYDQGDVSPHAAMFIGAGLYQRLYERRSSRTRRNYAVSLLVDASASMLSPGRAQGASTSWAMPAALLGAWTMAHLCDELRIEFEVALFNRGFAATVEDTEASYRRKRSDAIGGLRRTHGTAADRLTSTVNHYLVKPFERRWRDSEPTLAGLFYTAAEPRQAAALARRDPDTAPPVSLFEKAANVDEFNVIHAAERMSRLGAEVRVLMVLADGMTRGSVTALRRSVQVVETSGTTVIGIGIGDHTVDDAYRRHEVVGRPVDLARAMIDGTRNALRRSLALQGMDTWWFRASEAYREEERDIA